VHGVPEPKIRMFTMGTNKDYDYETILISDKQAQISHLALEAARIAANRHLRNEIGRADYFLRVLIYPHHVVREHRMMAFAGADRLQDGMRKAFGKVIGVAARVSPNQPLITIRTDRAYIQQAMRALKKAAPKMPTPCKINFDKIDPELKKKLGYGS